MTELPNFSIELQAEMDFMLQEFKDQEIGKILTLRQSDPIAFNAQRLRIETTTMADFIMRMIRDTALQHWRDREAKRRFSALDDDKRTMEGKL